MRRVGLWALIAVSAIGVLMFQFWLKPMLFADRDTKRLEQLDRRTDQQLTTTTEQAVRVDRKIKPTQPGDEGRRARRDADEQRTND
jgi:hypothetical protein